MDNQKYQNNKFDIAQDGTTIVVQRLNRNNSQDYGLWKIVVNNQGIQKELLNTDGSIQNCQFDPTAEHLYCWLTELSKGEVYIEKPYLAEINLKTGEINTLVTIAKYQESQVSVAPDGLGILFERSVLKDTLKGSTVPTTEGTSATDCLTASHKAMPSGLSLDRVNSSLPGEKKNSIWLAIPTEDLANKTISDLEQLPFIGFHPQWLP